MPSGTNAIEEVERLVLGHVRSSINMASVLAEARTNAEALAGTDDDERMERAALERFVVRALVGLWLEGGWGGRRAEKLLDGIEAATGLSRPSLTLAVLADPYLLELPPNVAIETVLGLLLALAPVRRASLWAGEPGAPLAVLGHAGPTEPTKRGREVALRAIRGLEAGPRRSAGLLQGVAVKRFGQAHAAIVVRPAPGAREACLPFLHAAASLMGPILEREALLRRNSAGERLLVQASERRLARLGLDLHDGPLQDVAVLANELRVFRDQLRGVVDGHQHAEVVLGRIDDLEAHLVALDGELRGISNSLEAPTIATRDFAEVVRGAVTALTSRTDISVDLSLDGEFQELTPSQRIALLRIVQESLSNAREHSGASRVEVVVAVRKSHIEASVADDGRGFDVDRALVQAARRGRLGLAGVIERIRLLGGTSTIRSSPGEGTVIAVRLPLWRPVADEPDAGLPVAAPGSSSLTA